MALTLTDLLVAGHRYQLHVLSTSRYWAPVILSSLFGVLEALHVEDVNQNALHYLVIIFEWLVANVTNLDDL